MNRIAIIGGGPAGLTAAIKAAETGYSTTLFEKNKVGENINCAEGYIDIMDWLESPKEGRLYKVKNIFIEIDEVCRLDVKDLNLWMLDRSIWQKKLKKRAEAQGVEIKENKMIKSTAFAQLKKDYDWIIDASGIPSVTSLVYNFKQEYQKEALFGVQYQYEGEFSNLDSSFKVSVLEDDFGYGWIFPKSERIANIGVGIFNNNGNFDLNGEKLYNKLKDFIIKQDIEGKIKDRSAGICPGKSLNSLVYDNVILIGDAAGLTSPLHGGGIDLARISAHLAVKSITNNNVPTYPKLLQKEIKEKQNMELFIKQLWNKFDKERLHKFVKLLSKTPLRKNEITNKVKFMKNII